MNIPMVFNDFVDFGCTSVMKSPSINICRGCDQDNSLWKTIRLYEVVNLEELLNLTKVSVPLKHSSQVFVR